MYPVEVWDCYDKRLPRSEDIQRAPPDAEFINSMFNPGQLQPIMVTHTKEDGWNLAFGRKRLLAIRALKLQERGNGEIYVMVGEGVSKHDANLISLIENAQRSSNEIADYIAIREILLSDPKATYTTIARQIGKTVTYVRTADQKFAKVPPWALVAVLDGKIAETTAVKVSKLNDGLQQKAHEQFETTQKLTGTAVDNLTKVEKGTQIATMNIQFPVMKKQFFPRTDLEQLLNLLSGGEVKPALKYLKSLLA